MAGLDTCEFCGHPLSDNSRRRYDHKLRCRHAGDEARAYYRRNGRWPKLRQKHSRDGSVRCDICAPMRCQKVRVK